MKEKHSGPGRSQKSHSLLSISTLDPCSLVFYKFVFPLRRYHHLRGAGKLGSVDPSMEEGPTSAPCRPLHADFFLYYREQRSQEWYWHSYRSLLSPLAALASSHVWSLSFYPQTVNKSWASFFSVWLVFRI